jgi:hypothetical protein
MQMNEIPDNEDIKKDQSSDLIKSEDVVLSALSEVASFNRGDK